MIAAGITIAILVLPIVIITSAEAIRAVPGAPAGGRASGWAPPAGRSSARQVLPYAAPGILTGTVLALARALGEAAPLMLVGAVGERLVDGYGFFDPAQLDRTVHRPAHRHHRLDQAPAQLRASPSWPPPRSS